MAGIRGIRMNLEPGDEVWLEVEQEVDGVW